jgi:hypothetical protein
MSKAYPLRLSDALMAQVRQAARIDEITVAQYIRISIQQRLRNESKRIIATERRQNDDTKDN